MTDNIIDHTKLNFTVGTISNSLSTPREQEAMEKDDLISEKDDFIIKEEKEESDISDD